MKYILILFASFVLFSCTISPSEKYNSKFIPFMQGNCVDRMVTMHDDLIKQGYKVELVIGTIIENGEKKGHAWIKYQDKKSGKWVSIYNY